MGIWGTDNQVAFFLSTEFHELGGTLTLYAGASLCPQITQTLLLKKFLVEKNPNIIYYSTRDLRRPFHCGTSIE